jgi:hypothetical protein
VLVLACGLAGCGNKNEEKVVGVWEWQINGATILMTVNKDGTASMKGPAEEKKGTWRIQRGNNFVFNDGRKDIGFVIESVDENMLQGTDPQSPGRKIVWNRKK